MASNQTKKRWSVAVPAGFTTETQAPPHARGAIDPVEASRAAMDQVSEAYSRA